MHAEERYLAAASERGQRSASETPCAESSGRSREPEIESQLSGLVAALGADVEVWIVRPPVLPASPEHADPGSSQDADRVRVVTATCPSGAVLLRGPLTGVSAVVGEGHERSAKPLVAGQAKEDGKLLSRGARNGRGTGFGGKLALGDEARSIIAEFGEDLGSVDASRARERGYDLGIGVVVECRMDGFAQSRGFVYQALERRGERSDDCCLRRRLEAPQGRHRGAA